MGNRIPARQYKSISGLPLFAAHSNRRPQLCAIIPTCAAFDAIIHDIHIELERISARIFRNLKSH